jgi:hypothetical protein
MVLLIQNKTAEISIRKKTLLSQRKGFRVNFYQYSRYFQYFILDINILNIIFKVLNISLAIHQILN